MSKQEIKYIAIIGGGPKGMYGLERLGAQLEAHWVPGVVEIHVFNRTPFFGSGDVYRSDQPAYLKMNICNREIDIWNKEEPAPVVPHHRVFTSWLKLHHARHSHAGDEGFSARATVGKYLEDSFRSIVQHLPPNVHVKKFVGEVTDLRQGQKGYQIQWKGSDAKDQILPYHYCQILLATGHPRKQLTAEEEEYLYYTRQEKGAGFVPFIYPVTAHLKDIVPGCKVGVKGLGLTFMDAVLALTEGRGGRFFYNTSQQLVYQSSGDEPKKIYPFSRSGLPMLSRGPALPRSRTLLQFFTPEAMQWAKEEKCSNIDFEADLWPLLKQEILHAYYAVLFRKHNFYVERKKYTSFHKLLKHIDLFHAQHPEVSRFNVERFLNPLAYTRCLSGQSFHKFILTYIRKANQAARIGPRYSPLAAVSQVWRAATPVFDAAFQWGGLTPASHKKFADHYDGILQRITYGPPVENMEKMVALAESGILDFSIGPCEHVCFSKQERRFEVTSGIAKIQHTLHYLIDARIPKVSIADTTAGLYANLLRRGEVTLYENKCADTKDFYRPGCMALQQDGFVINSKNEINTTMTATGTPTEGITYDNDTLSPVRNNFVSKWAERIREEFLNEMHHATT